ncbi:MAG: ABC transporter substrate-binding protein, partial [Actinomycetota bacterium]
MLTKKWLRLLAVLLAFGLVAAACGDSDDDAGDDTEAEAADETEATEAPEETEAPTEDTEAPDETEAPTEDTEAPDAAGGGGGDGVLTIGTILPVTGDLAFLGPPEVAGAELAAQDINAAGGVLGQELVLIQGDSGDTTTDIANQEVDRLLAAGADAIMGAASSAVSKTVIDKITGAGVIQFSPANTSPDFTTYDDGGLYFRTAPSDLLQGRVLANTVL